MGVPPQRQPERAQLLPDHEATVDSEPVRRCGGGPIKRNKTFVFGTYEGIRDRRQAAATTALPPTAAEVAGDFSHLNRIKQLVNPADNTPFPGNRIPTSLFDPAARKLLTFIPVVQSGGLQAVGPNPRDSDLFMVRWDLTMTSKQSLFAHYLNETSQENPALAYSSNIAGWTGQKLGPRFQNRRYQSHLDFVAGSSGSNDARLRSYSLNTPTVTRTPEELGISGMPMYTDGGSPQFSISGRAAVGLRRSRQIRFERLPGSGKH